MYWLFSIPHLSLSHSHHTSLSYSHHTFSHSLTLTTPSLTLSFRYSLHHKFFLSPFFLHHPVSHCFHTFSIVLAVYVSVSYTFLNIYLLFLLSSPHQMFSLSLCFQAFSLSHFFLIFLTPSLHNNFSLSILFSLHLLFLTPMTSRKKIMTRQFGRLNLETFKIYDSNFVPSRTYLHIYFILFFYFFTDWETSPCDSSCRTHQRLRLFLFLIFIIF